MTSISIKDSIRQKIEQGQNQAVQVWATFIRHSADYAAALKLSSKDLDGLAEIAPRLSMFPDLKEIAEGSVVNVQLNGGEVDGHELAICCKHVCGKYYGGEWGNFLFAICVSDTSVNTEHGRGTTTISVLPEDIHQKLCEHLKQG